MLATACYEAGPADGPAVVLLHGFPDDVRAYNGVVPPLAAGGWRVLVPYLRGYGPTRFLDPRTPRSGQQAALGHDLKEFIDALGLEPGLVTIMIHTGSRGLGHQVCTEALARMQPAMRRFGISLPDRQLACAPVE